MSVIRRTATLPDSSNKTDFYSIVDSSTVDTIVNADIDASAAISDTKLAQLSTANKVSAAALCSLSALPAGAGVLPFANLSYASIPNSALVPISLASWIDGGSFKNLASIPSGAGVIPAANIGSSSIYVGKLARDLTANSGDVSTTGVGFQPTAIFCIANVDANAATSWGLAYSTLAVAVFNYHNVSANTFARGSQDQVVSIYMGVGSSQIANLKSFDSDGFTLTWTKSGSPTGSADIFYLCIK